VSPRAFDHDDIQYADGLTENEVRAAEENEYDEGSNNGPILDKMVGNRCRVREQDLDYNKANETYAPNSKQRNYAPIAPLEVISQTGRKSQTGVWN
jgi:hypothetical protein